MGAPVTYPVFVVCRDLVTPLIALLDWLETVDQADEVYLLDNDSTYEPLLDFYATTRHTVLHAGGNHGHKVGWTTGILRQYAPHRRFVYTDPDVLPIDECPADALERIAAVLDADKQAVKCGFSIHLDDVHPYHRDGVLAWEGKFWNVWDKTVGAWRAPIDTTFALHRAGQDRRHRYKPAYRLPAPYSVRHVPWHSHPDDMTAEEAYYVAHADRTVSNWARHIQDRAS